MPDLTWAPMNPDQRIQVLQNFVTSLEGVMP